MNNNNSKWVPILLLFAILSLPTAAARISSALESASGVYKFESCLTQLESRVCDPDNMLGESVRRDLDGALADLERATSGGEVPKWGWVGRLALQICSPNGGLQLEVLLLGGMEVDFPGAAEKVRELNWRHHSGHPCAKSAVILLAPGQRPSAASRQTPIWSRFFAAASGNTRTTQEQLRRLYTQAAPQILAGDVGAALKQIIRGIRAIETAE